jgi:hypothetical protein
MAENKSEDETSDLEKSIRDVVEAEKLKLGAAPIPQKCLKCGGAVTEIVYGLVDPAVIFEPRDGTTENPELSEFRKQLRDGEVTLGGCVVGPDNWECRSCGHRWG